MYCKTCNKDIAWIEVHLVKHKVTLEEYLQQEFQSTSCFTHEERQACQICERDVKWLQDHVAQQHGVDDFLSYLFEHHLDEKIYKKVKARAEDRYKKLGILQHNTNKRVLKLSEPDYEVLAYQRGEVKFVKILNRWSSKIQAQVRQSSNLLTGMSKYQGAKEMEQELHTALYIAAKTYNSEKAKFNTHMWNCLRGQVYTITSHKSAQKRNFKLVSADDLLSSNSPTEQENNDKISLFHHYRNSEEIETKTSLKTLLRGLEKLELNEEENLVIKALMCDYTKQQIADLLLTSVEEVTKIISNLRAHKKLYELVAG